MTRPKPGPCNPGASIADAEARRGSACWSVTTEPPVVRVGHHHGPQTLEWSHGTTTEGTSHPSCYQPARVKARGLLLMLAGDRLKGVASPERRGCPACGRGVRLTQGLWWMLQHNQETRMWDRGCF